MLTNEQINFIQKFVVLQGQLVSLALAWQLNYSKRWFNRRWHVRPFFKKRKTLGLYNTMIKELKDDPDLFFQFTRMDLSIFEHLCEILCPYLTKRNTDIRSEQRLIITLRFLATGDNIKSIAIAFRISPSLIYKIIEETCQVIYSKLAPTVLSVPSYNDWLKISKGFEETWNMPNCCGAIDGKHVQIKAPDNSFSLFFNYKKTYSIVLLAVCDDQYRFKLVDIGACGSESDGGILARSSLGKAIRDKELNFPMEKRELPGTNIEFPYFFVGDGAFELTPHMMCPYTGKSLDERKSIYNYRLSRARRMIESSFGILAARWQFLKKSIGLRPSFVINCVQAALCLHNLLMGAGGYVRNKRYSSGSFVDQETESHEIVNGGWSQIESSNAYHDMNNIHFQEENLNSRQISAIRDQLADYFVTQEGEVYWQYDYVRRGRNTDL